MVRACWRAADLLSGGCMLVALLSGAVASAGGSGFRMMVPVSVMHCQARILKTRPVVVEFDPSWQDKTIINC